MLKRLVLISILFLPGCSSLGIMAFCPFQYNDAARRIVASELNKKYKRSDMAERFEIDTPHIYRYSDGVDIRVLPDVMKVMLYEGRFVVQINPCNGQLIRSYYHGFNGLYETD